MLMAALSAGYMCTGPWRGSQGWTASSGMQHVRTGRLQCQNRLIIQTSDGLLNLQQRCCVHSAPPQNVRTLITKST